MVAIVSGNGLGVANSSASVLGQRGVFGNAGVGGGKDGTYVNIANGNLALRGADEFLAFHGVKLDLTRTYNSRATLGGAANDWQNGLLKQITKPTGLPNADGSTVTRVDSDGSTDLFIYDKAKGYYKSTDGGGAYQTLTYAAGKWTWHSERTVFGATELGAYEVYDDALNGYIVNGGDQAGVRTTYSYTKLATSPASYQLTRLTDSGGDVMDFVYTAGNLTKVSIKPAVTNAGDAATAAFAVAYTYDTFNRLNSVSVDLTPAIATDALAQTTVYLYENNADGTPSQRITSITQFEDALVKGVATSLMVGRQRFGYDNGGRIASYTVYASATDKVGRTTTLEYGIADPGTGVAITGVIDPMGNRVAYSYDALGRLLAVDGPPIDGVGQHLGYNYDADGNLTFSIDALGLATVYTYDSYGHWTSQRDSTGNVLTRTYAAGSNLLTSETAYQSSGPGGEPTQPLTTRYVYDASNRLRYQLTPAGRVTEYVYPTATQVEYSATRLYAANLYPVPAGADTPLGLADMDKWIVGKRVQLTDITYNVRGLVSRTQTYKDNDTISTATSYTYNAFGQVLTSVDGNGAITIYSYDGLGRQLSKSIGGGGSASPAVTYTNIVGTAISVTANDKSVTVSTYDMLGQLVSVQQPGISGTTGYAYDAAGRLRMTTAPDGQKTYLVYDKAGRNVASVAATGAVTTLLYNAANQVIKTTGYATLLTSFAALAPDADGNFGNDTLAGLKLDELASNADRNSWNFYDGAGRLVDTVDANGLLTHYEYDPLARLTATTARATRFNPDALIKLTPAQLAQTRGVAQTDSPDDRTTRRWYDADGLLARTDAGGYQTVYKYNAVGLLVDTTSYGSVYNNGVAADLHESRWYDSQNRLAGIVDGEGYLTELSYDLAGNLLKRTRYAAPVRAADAATLALLKASINATITRDGVSVSYSNAAIDNRSTEYVYNALNQLISETTTDGAGITVGNRTVYAYDANGNLSSSTRTNGTADGATYDAFGHVLSETRAGVATVYTYNAVGLRTSMTEAGTKRTVYYYNAAGQPTFTIDDLGAVQQRSYDAFGQVVATRRYDRQIDQSLLTGGRDDDSALTKQLGLRDADQRAVFYYDQGGRLRYSVAADGQITGQQYNGFGQLSASVHYKTALSAATVLSLTTSTVADEVNQIVKGGAAASTRFEYDHDGRLTVTTDALGARSALAYDGFGRISVRSQGLSQQRYAYDRRGAVTDYTDPAGNHVNTSYNAFGEAVKAIRRATPGSIADSALDSISRTVYDEDGRVAATIDALGALTTYAYNGDGKVIDQISYKRPLSALVLPVIDGQAANGGLATAKMLAAYMSTAGAPDVALDAHQKFSYDTRGRLTTIATAIDGAQWAITTQVYDNNDRVVQRTSYATKAASAATVPAAAPNDARVRYVYDDLGRLTDTLSAQTSGVWTLSSQQYDRFGNVLQRTAYAADIRVAAPTSDDIAKVKNAASSANAITVYQYDSANRVTLKATTQNAAAAGGQVNWAVSAYRYDSSGNLERSTDYADAAPLDVDKAPTQAPPANALRDRITSHTYDDVNRLKSTTDAVGGITVFDYDERGNLIKRTQQSGLPDDAAHDRVSRTIYDLNNRARYQIDAAGAVTRYDYNALGKLAAAVSFATPLALAARDPGAANFKLPDDAADDRVTRYIYDTAGQLRYTVDALGYLTEQRYDGVGRVTQTLRYMMASLPGAFAGDYSVAQATKVAATLATALAPAQSTGFTYDARGKVLTATDAMGYPRAYVYDALGNKISFTNELANTWEYSYDAAGRLLTEKAPSVMMFASGDTANSAGLATRLVTRMVYDTFGNLTSRTEADGTAQQRTTSYAYDRLGRQVQTTLAPVAVYDALAAADAASRTELAAAPHTVTVLYDTLGNAVQSTDVDGNISYKVYDSEGRVRYDIDAAGRVTGYLRNGFGEVAAMTRYAGELTVAEVAALRGAGTLPAAMAASPLNRTINTAYDALGRAALVTEPSVLVFDQRSQTSFQSARTTATEYNAFGQQRRQAVYGTRADGLITAEAVTRSYYDQRGNKRAEIAALSDVEDARKGYLSTFAYDAAGNQELVTEFATEISNWSDNGYDSAATAVADRVTGYRYDSNNRRIQEIRSGWVAAPAGGKAADSVTEYKYDATGNQTTVVDANLVTAFTYYDALGRAVAVAKLAALVNPTSTPQSQFKLDAHGNVVVRIDYAAGAPTVKTATVGTVVALFVAPAASPDDRVTLTRYDLLGHAVQITDAMQSVSYASYDVYGHVAKQWRSVSNALVGAPVMTAYQVNRYDKLGRLVEVVSPGNENLIIGAAAAPVSHRYQYNGFGELIRHELPGGLGSEQTDFDNAGHAWRTNSGDGVYRVVLFDAQGNATVQVRDTGAYPSLAEQLAKLATPPQALALPTAQRTDTRYDLLGRVVDVRQSGDAALATLVRDAQTGRWSRQALAPDASGANSLLIVGDGADAGKVLTVQYRLDGGPWIDGSGRRMEQLDGTWVFNTTGLAKGGYEYRVFAQPLGKPAYEREMGRFSVATGLDVKQKEMLSQLYVVLLNRAPDLKGLNYYTRLLNDGASVSQIATSLLTSDEGRLALAGDAVAVIKKIFLLAFGRDGNNPAGDPGYAAEVALWAGRYGDAVAANAAAAARAPAGTAAGGAPGQVMLDMIAVILGNTSPSPALGLIQSRINSRVAATLAYLAAGGNNELTARAIFDLATTDAVKALRDANALGLLESRRAVIAQTYLTLFSRPPVLAEMTERLADMAAGKTIEQLVVALLDTAEARTPMLYQQWAGQSAQDYEQRVVYGVYGNLLRRLPSAAEMAAATAAMADPGKGADPAQRCARFITGLIHQVASYVGQDAGLLAQKQLFNNQLAVALSYAQLSFGDKAVGTTVIANVTGGLSAAEAVTQALANAVTREALAGAINASAALAAAASPIENMQTQLARLYVVLFNRVPDSGGFAFYMNRLGTPAVPPVPMKTALINVANDFLGGAESKKDGTLAGVTLVGTVLTPLSDSQFVERLYTLALGKLPTSAGARAEMAAFVAQLGSKTRGEVALNFVNGALGFEGLTPDEAAMKATLANKVAVALVCATDLAQFNWPGTDNPAVGKAILAQVGASGTQRALDTAYQLAQDTLKRVAAGNIAAATSAAAALARAASAALTADNAAKGVQGAATAAAAEPSAMLRLQIMRMYVGILGRDAASYRLSADIDGFNFTVGAAATTPLAEVAQSMIIRGEGLLRYPATMENGAFVAKLAATLMGTATAAPAQLAAWTAQLNAPASQTRGQVAMAMLDFVAGFDAGTDGREPNAASLSYVVGRQRWFQNVAESFAVLDIAQLRATQVAASAVAPVLEADEALRQLQAAKASADKVAADARAGATDALATANAAGDRSANMRYQITLLYATLLQRQTTPKQIEIDFYTVGRVPGDLPAIAQSLIDSAEARDAALFPVDNAAFITALYKVILGRTPMAADIAFYSKALVDKVGGANSRGTLALAILNDYSRYSDNTAEQLTRKVLFDQKITGMLAQQKLEADTAASSALGAYNTLHAAAADAGTAMTAAINERDAWGRMVKNAAADAAEAQIVLANPALQKSVTQVFLGLRGYVDFPGMAFWIGKIAAGVATRESMIPEILDVGGYSADLRSYITDLYNHVLARPPTANEVASWVATATASKLSRSALAIAFLDSAEGVQRLTPLVDAQVRNDINYVATPRITLNALFPKKYDAAVLAATVATTAYTKAAAAEQQAAAALSTANGVAAALTALLGAQALQVPADKAYLKAAYANDASVAAQKRSDEAHRTYAAEITTYAAAQPAASGDHAAALLAAAQATLAAARADVDTLFVNAKAVPALQQQSVRIVQLYLGLMNRPPLLAEIHFWTDRMAAGATAQQIAAALMADGGVGTALYPTTLGNDAFVTQMYRFALERDFSQDPGGLRYWSDQLNGPKPISRAELAVNLLASLPLADNSDSTRFYNRMTAAMQALVAEAGGSAGPQLQPAILLAQQNLRATAAAYNATVAPAQDARAGDLRSLARLYVGLLNRLPDAAGVAFWVAGMQKGASLAVIAQQMVSSSEGRIAYPAGLSDRDFIRQVFSSAMGRAPFDVEIAPYVELAATLPRGEVAMYLLNGIADGPGGNLLEETTRTVFNAKVRTALDTLAATIGGVIDNAHLAELALTAIQTTNPVDRHADDLVSPVVSTISGGLRHSSEPDQLRLDRWGQIVARADVDDPYRLTSYSYNDGGQLLTTSRTIDGVTIATSSSYDALGNMLTATDARGFVNRYVYDANNVVKQEFHADNATTTASVTYTNDAFGQHLATLQNVGNSSVGAVATTYTYDRLGRQKTRSSAAVDAWYAPELHASGNPPDMFTIKATYQVAMIDSYEYDELGRRIASSQSSATSFPVTGGVAVTDLNKTTVTRVRYDLGGNIIATIDALGYENDTAYDALNHKVASRDAEGGKMRWDVDAFGRVTGHDDLAGRHTSYVYNAAGQLTGQASSGGQNLVYRYADGRLIEINDQVLHQVTSYTYDASGNRLTEKVWLADAGRALQDTTNTYDGHGRLVEIASAVSAVGANYRVKYQYDNNGNRLSVTTTYNNALGGLRTITVNNTFDAVNRQNTVGGGVVTTYANNEDARNTASYHIGDGAIESHAITYDWIGNRIKDVHGTEIDIYNYDAAGRLSTVTNKAGSYIASRKYDGAGRVIESLDNGEVHVNAYDRGGHLLRQRIAARGGKAGTDFSGGQYTNDIFYLSDIKNNVSGYDKLGNLVQYQVLNGIDVQNAKRYINTYDVSGKFDSYQVTSTVASAARASSVTVNKQYDVNGHLAATDGKDGRTLLSDSEGRILEKTQNGVVTHTLMANGEVIGSSNEQMETFSSGFESISSPTLSAAPSVYIVGVAGQTLQTIAKAVWGDSRLWYLIADANGGIDDKDLQPGQPLNLPARVNTVLNGAQTFKPYNAADAVGDTTPQLPTPSHGGGGCGGVGKLIMVAVAVAVTIYTAGVLAGPTTGFFETMTAGAGALTGGGFAAYGAVAAAAGSVASQAVGIAIGAQDGFSWKSVALSAIGGAVSGGLPANVGGFGNVYASAVARAAVSSVAVQGLSIVSGLQNGFDWRSVAAASAGAVAGQAFSGSTIFGNSALAQRTVSGFAAGTAASIMRGGKIDVARIATDAFGNALGSSLAEIVSGDGRMLARRPVSDFISITPVDPNGPSVNVQELLAGVPESQGAEAFYVPQAAASSPGQLNGDNPFTVYPGGIGANDTGPDRQTTLNYADGSMVPVVTRTTNRMWALGQMELEANQQAGLRDPADILRQANELAWAPKGTAYDGESVWTTLGLVEAAKRRQDVDPLMTAQLTSAWRDVYQRGAVENVIRPFKTIQGMPAQFKEDAIGAQAFGGASLRAPRPALNYVLPTTKAGHATYTIGTGWAETGGSGPAPGIIGITDRTAAGALRNYFPSGGAPFVYDTATNTFVAGQARVGLFNGSQHEQLAQSIGASGSSVVGGTFTRGANGEFMTTENSGHYGMNWTNPKAQQFQSWLSNRVNVPVDHQSWSDR